MTSFIEFTIGKNNSRRYIRADTITRLIEYTEGQYGPKTGVCVEGEEEPMWVALSYDEVVALLKKAIKPAKPKALRRKPEEDPDAP